MKIGLGSSLFWMSESHRVSRLGALSITNRECPLLACRLNRRRNTGVNLSAGVSNCKVSRGRSFSWRATLFR